MSPRAETTRKKGPLAGWGRRLDRLTDRLPSSSNRRLLRQIIAAVVAGQAGFFIFGMFGHSLALAVAAGLLGAGAGVAAVSAGAGVRGWVLLWMLNGTGWGFGLGGLEGLFYSLVWSLPGTFLGLCWALFLWTRIERLNESWARRLVNASVGVFVTALPVAALLGAMNVGGKVVPVLDLGLLLDLAPTSPIQGDESLLLRTSGYEVVGVVGRILDMTVLVIVQWELIALVIVVDQLLMIIAAHVMGHALVFRQMNVAQV